MLLKEYRCKNNYTLGGLSKEFPKLVLYECGQLLPTVAELKRLSILYKCKMDDLVFWERDESI